MDTMAVGKLNFSDRLLLLSCTYTTQGLASAGHPGSAQLSCQPGRAMSSYVSSIRSMGTVTEMSARTMSNRSDVSLRTASRPTYAASDARRLRSSSGAAFADVGAKRAPDARRRGAEARRSADLMARLGGSSSTTSLVPTSSFVYRPRVAAGNSFRERHQHAGTTAGGGGGGAAGAAAGATAEAGGAAGGPMAEANAAEERDELAAPSFSRSLSLSLADGFVDAGAAEEEEERAILSPMAIRFNRFDTNRDGVLDRAEVRLVPSRPRALPVFLPAQPFANPSRTLGVSGGPVSGSFHDLTAATVPAAG